MNEEVYFNFPISIIELYPYKPRATIQNIYKFCVYEHYLDLTENATSAQINNISDIERFKISLKHYDFSTDINNELFESSKKIYKDSIKNKCARAGVKKGILNRYDYEFEDMNFDEVCFLMFIGLKSIMGNSSYKKTNKKLLFNRMLGKNKTDLEIENLPHFIKKYTSEYQFTKMIQELEINWNLKYYSRHMRGFCFSFTLDLSHLITTAERNKESNKKKIYQENKKKIIKETLNKLR